MAARKPAPAPAPGPKAASATEPGSARDGAAQLKPAYLIHGDDHGAIAERRAGLRALIEAGPDGSAGLEVLEEGAATPAGAAAALAAMTLAVGHRVILVEGAERWRQADVERELLPALKSMPPDTTIAFFAREDAGSGAPDALAKAVRAAHGQIVAHMVVKPWELPGWVREQAARLGVSLDSEASRTLVRQVGDRPQRLLRELEKLALEAGAPDVTVDAEQVEQRAAHSAEWRAYALADALVAGDTARATASYLGVRQQGENLSGLIYLMARRLREALSVAVRMEAGESAAAVKRSLRMPSRAADRFIADVSRSDPERLQRALGALADLELDSRGGSAVLSHRSALAPLDEETIALRAIDTITA
jgi:DNA polymerase III subunit delta